jgi:phage repressor protein C with HTH and peptisase S24 domain
MIFYAAAGTFSEIQSERDFTLIEGPENSKNDYFACKIVGESMNRVIPNGSICLFKPYTGGSRNGKIVLVDRYSRSRFQFLLLRLKRIQVKKVVTEKVGDILQLF